MGEHWADKETWTECQWLTLEAPSGDELHPSEFQRKSYHAMLRSQPTDLKHAHTNISSSEVTSTYTEWVSEQFLNGTSAHIRLFSTIHSFSALLPILVPTLCAFSSRLPPRTEDRSVPVTIVGGEHNAFG